MESENDSDYGASSKQDFVREEVYIPPNPGAQNMLLTAQPRQTWALLQADVACIIAEAIFVDFFPPAAKAGKNHAHILIEIGEAREYDNLLDCLCFDDMFCELSSKVVCN